MDGSPFGAWTEVQGGGKTNAPLAAATFGNRLYIFGKGTDDKIYVNSAKEGYPWGGWTEVQGGGKTNAPLAAAAFGERLYIFGKGTDDKIYVNSAKEGYPWGGWTEVQGGGKTNVALAAAAFGERLYIFGKGTDDKIYVNSAKEGYPWGGWSEVQGGGKTNVALAAAAFGERLYIFSKGMDDRIYVNSALDGYPWGGWTEVQGGGKTNVALAAAAFGERLYIFGKGTDDRIYVNATKKEQLKLAAVLVSVNDLARVTTLTSAWVRRALSRTADYFRDQSGGRAAPQFQVFEWFQLPVTSAQWHAWGTDAGRHVRDLVPVDLSGFKHLLLIIDEPNSGGGVLVPDGSNIHVAARDIDPALLCHEIGHICGAAHANLDSANGPIEYGDRFCTMGHEGTKYTFLDAALNEPNNPGGDFPQRHTPSGPGMVASTLRAIGWLDLANPNVGNNITTKLNGLEPFTVALRALQGAPVIGYVGPPVVAYADRTGGQRLMIEYRYNDGWDRQLPTSVGGWIVLHMATGAASLQIGAVEAKPGNSIGPWKAGAKVVVDSVDPNRRTVNLRVQRMAH